MHNQAILDFYHRHRTRCVLGHVNALASDLAGAVSICARKFGVDLASDGVSSVYHPAELTRHLIPDEIFAEFRELTPSVAALYGHLELAADLPDPASIRSSRPDARERTETSGQQIELLLSRLAPRAVLAGKWALDEFRRRQLGAAAGQEAAAEASIVQRETDLRTRAAHNSELARTIAEQERLLAAIGRTRAWRAAQKWYAFKRAGLRLFGCAR